MINTEKFYKEVIKLKELFDEESQKWIEKAVKVNEKSVCSPAPWCQVANLIIDLRAEMAKESVKKTGKNALFKYCNDILKYNKGIDGREALCFSKVLSDGYQYVCDGYRAVKLKTSLPLPACPDDIGFPHLDQIVPRTLKGYERIENLPTVERLKTYCKICRAEQKNILRRSVIYRLGNDLPYINAKWLYETMEALPNAMVYASKYNILFIDEHQDITAMILAIRIADETFYQNVEVA